MKKGKVIVFSLVSLLLIIAAWQSSTLNAIDKQYARQEYKEAYQSYRNLIIPSLYDNPEKIEDMNLIASLEGGVMAYAGHTDDISHAQFVAETKKALARCIGYTERAKQYNYVDDLDRFKEYYANKLVYLGFDPIISMRKALNDEEFTSYFGPLYYDESVVSVLAGIHSLNNIDLVTPIPSTKPTPKPTFKLTKAPVKHYCTATGCTKEGTIPLEHIFDKNTIEYYCSQHYQEMMDILQMMIEDVYGN